MYGQDVYKNLGEDLVVPDPNGILDLKNLKPIGKLIKNNMTDLSNIKLDDEDLGNLMNWYNNYKIIYSYPEREHNLSEKWKAIFAKINKNKGDSDIMGLVEIAIGRLLQSEFEKKGHDVRVRKTSNFDDITSGLDYIVEYRDKNGNIDELVGVDFTISEKGAESLSKNIKKEAFPNDYKVHYEKRYNKKLKKIPRVVMSLGRDFAYSFTNNFFISVLEEGHLLDNDDIKENFGYAVMDIKNINVNDIHFKVSNVLSDTNKKIDKLLPDF